MGSRKFTPDVFVSAPRRSDGVPNHDASKILYTESSYDLAEHKKASTVGVFHTASRSSTTLADGDKASSPAWLDPASDDVVLLVKGEHGATHLTIGRVDDFQATSYVAGSFDGAVDNVVLTRLGERHYGLAVSGEAAPDGSIFNAETAKKPHSSGMSWTGLFVRRWDHWVGPNSNSIWYASLRPAAAGSDKYAMSAPRNALAGTGLESPLQPSGDLDSFDISPSGVVFVSKDPHLDPATHTKCNIYLLPLATFDEPPAELLTPHLGDLQGALISPKFSPDGRKVAFLAMQEDGYESDRNQICLIDDVSRPGAVTTLFPSPDGRGAWDRSPTSVAWSRDGSTLYLAADDEGTRRLFSTPASLTTTHPQRHASEGSIGAAVPLADGTVFQSTSSLIDSCTYAVLTHAPGAPPDGATQLLYSATSRGSLWGLSPTQVHSLSYPGVPNAPLRLIHTLEIRPSDFDPTKTYPIAVLIHGGPQAAWNDAFSQRWPAALYAEQGYLVLQPNITGSTGYGQAHVDAISRDWSGAPLADISALLDYLSANVPYADTSRAILAGASFGGFASLRAQGLPLGRRFNAMFAQCGIFSAGGTLATDELYFMNRDHGGSWLDPAARPAWTADDPAGLVEHWATPMLLVHGVLDYRLTVGESLAAFNCLQMRGVESKLVVFPDEGHHVLKGENARAYWSEVFAFLNPKVGLPAWRVEGAAGAVVMDPTRVTDAGAARIRVVK